MAFLDARYGGGGGGASHRPVGMVSFSVTWGENALGQKERARLS